jgi:hypothetical protein
MVDWLAAGIRVQITVFNPYKIVRKLKVSAILVTKRKNSTPLKRVGFVVVHF